MHWAKVVGVYISLLTPIAVQGRLEDPSWMLLPDDRGKLHLAILHGPNFADKINPIEDIQFFLYTRSNLESPDQVFLGDLGNSTYDPSLSTKIVIHGFGSSSFEDWVLLIKDAYLRTEDCNVICLDWSRISGAPLYNVARDNALPTGQYLAQMIDFLVSLGGGSVEKFHVMGSSLGAHVAGYAGKVVTSGNLPRITGLDPALPLFSFEENSDRLNNTDAMFVDIIHTCSGWLGFDVAIGHVDFYPNGGKNQPGCGIDLTGACSHKRSRDFFAETIETTNFRGVPCDSWEDFESNLCTAGETVPMGEHLDSSVRGIYYLATAAESPYALG